MKLSLTVEADSINVLVLSMDRVSVDIDGIKLSDLIDVVCDNGYSFRVADTPDKLIVEDPPPPIARVNGIQCSIPDISRRKTILCCLLFHTSMKTLVRLNGFYTPAQVICST